MKEYIKAKYHTFEIVDSVPAGYQIWNIGHNMPEGYLPLCMTYGEDGCQVNTATLKAIRLEGAQIILNAVGGGQNTIQSMERYIKRYSNAKPGSYAYRQVQRIEKALPIMRQINWN